VTCLACAPDTDVAPDTAGASAAAEAERRKEKRVEEVRRQYGHHAAEVAEEMAGRDMDATWGKGSEGESRLAAFVAREVGDKVIALHDRLIPGTRGNIDHIFVVKGTNVHAALCFVESDWGLLDFPFQVGNVWVFYPGALRKRLKKDGPLSPEAMKRIARRLDVSLPRAGRG
jgi:hypothetical protein